MSNPTPAFFNGPLRYIRWSARERPAYLYSVVLGAAGLVMLATVPPLQKRFGYERAKPIPMTYPSRFSFCSYPPRFFVEGAWKGLETFREAREQQETLEGRAGHPGRGDVATSRRRKVAWTEPECLRCKMVQFLA